jgi:hypothetical protein
MMRQLPADQAAQADLRVVRGEPDDVEVAALTAVLASLASGQNRPPAQPPRSLWADRAALLRGPVRPGSGGWRASLLPR